MRQAPPYICAGLALWIGLIAPFSAIVTHAAPSNSEQLKKQSGQHSGIEKNSSQSSAPEGAVWKERRDLYEQISILTGIPWYRLAAIDQYERALTKANPKQRKHPDRLTGIYVDPLKWVGMMNPDINDNNPKSISLFRGIGRDGSGDKRADSTNDVDLLYSVASRIGAYGPNDEDFGNGLWNYYTNPRAVQRVQQYARIFEHFDKLDLFEYTFPLPLGSSYSYRSTFGMGRHYGGYRIHEGTDIFAGYGVPVRSTCYGIVEVKGWNRYGGWRIGIRDLNNIYHYYAHLSGYEKNIKVGDIVTPGQTVGWVGSSGYGKPGTSGKFPPHLHYGLYRDRGLVEYAFDPFPLLYQWEQSDKRKRMKSNRR
ncbi:M23 family metallopeptidase [Paenibacillus alvei]|uniref:M23 family metallopeptidase n=1 Tax=Paenibacillus alvei TaxID=44250 RepID=A0ABT4H1M2_PAEAL|nr:MULTISPECIES: M23 family metallopeptidase [Paenibacillus]EJW15029.1 L-Ala--D-Glu endopeptidase LytH [Paenibacillus alvei DSM 29]MCY7483433.1 M23 family metallopeptidase [Paenibacillus alvei]MCY9541070.1 M23 family metallopeptidase [Paenibacillus alvei]MCY9703767.1 M23 family metallopeptidase [Paenibacillus alvei]MCY9757274.1 M23 family metallopeptidase [Paenibacillus alvei]